MCFVNAVRKHDADVGVQVDRTAAAGCELYMYGVFQLAHAVALFGEKKLW